MNTTNVVCYNCNETGHYANVCPQRQRMPVQQQPPTRPPQVQTAAVSAMFDEFKEEMKTNMAKLQAEIITINKNQSLYELNGAIDPQQFGKLLSSVAGIKKDIQVIAVAHKAQQARVANISTVVEGIGRRVADLDYKLDEFEKHYTMPTAEELGIDDDDDDDGDTGLEGIIEETEEEVEEAAGVGSTTSTTNTTPLPRQLQKRQRKPAAAAAGEAPATKRRAARK